MRLIKAIIIGLLILWGYDKLKKKQIMEKGLDFWKRDSNLERLNDSISCYADELLQLVKNDKLTVTQKFIQMKNVAKMIDNENICIYED